jgi:hypothetical protein
LNLGLPLKPIHIKDIVELPQNLGPLFLPPLLDPTILLPCPQYIYPRHLTSGFFQSSWFHKSD